MLTLYIVLINISVDKNVKKLQKALKKQHPNFNLTHQWHMRTSGDVYINYHSLEYYAEVSKLIYKKHWWMKLLFK